MENEKIISANNLTTAIRDDLYINGRSFARVVEHINNAPTVDAVEMVRIQETKQYILQVLDTLIETVKPLYEWTTDNSYYGGKLAAFEISRRLVNAALTDLCRED